MDVHLVDGTYELFRHYYAVPSRRDDGGTEIGAARGVVTSMTGMLDQGATHLGVATDHVVESFRNDLWHGYKTSAGVPPELLAQFAVLEDALSALGLVVWAEVELEADDALASAAAVAEDDARVEHVLVCTPDKDLAQCVRGVRVMQLDRRSGARLDEEGVRAKYGVAPESIPDWLALVGDAADGFPGLPGWGPRSASAVLARYGHLEDVPTTAAEWDVDVHGAARLAATLLSQRADALRFRVLATLRLDAEVGTVDDWEWRGPDASLGSWEARLALPGLTERASVLASRRG